MDQHMNINKYLLQILVIPFVFIFSLPAQAYRGGWGLGAGLIAGGIIGAELSRPYYYPAPAYVYTPPVVVQQPVVVQIGRAHV